MKKKMDESRRRELLSDCLLVGGATAVSVGVSLFHIAAGLITGGVLAIVYGWLIAQGGGKT